MTPRLPTLQSLLLHLHRAQQQPPLLLWRDTPTHLILQLTFYSFLTVCFSVRYSSRSRILNWTLPSGICDLWPSSIGWFRATVAFFYGCAWIHGVGQHWFLTDTGNVQNLITVLRWTEKHRSISNRVPSGVRSCSGNGRLSRLEHKLTLYML